MIINNQFGLDMYVEVSGNVDSNTTVMFLNGVMASVSSWNDIKKPFEKLGFRVVCHDFVGQLKSNPLTSVYSFEMHAKDVIHIMDTLQISSAYLIGTSYGGEISIKLASLYPNRVDGMAVINSVSETDALMIATVNHWKKLCDIEDKEVFFWGMATSIYGVSYMEKFYDTMAIRAKAMNQLPASYFSSLKFLIDTFVKDANMTKELVNVKCPTLVICGEDDRLKPVKYSQIIAKSIVNSEFLLIVDCGHVTIFEQTETLVSALVGFFLKLRR